MTRIAVLEAARDQRDDHAQHLRHAGHEVLPLADWHALHAAMGSFAPQILVTDEQLPGGDGLPPIARLRQQQPDIGLIVINRSIRPADRLAAYRHGADHVLASPVLVDELVLVARNLARRIEPEAAAAWTLDLAGLTLTAPGGPNTALTSSEVAVMQAIARAVHQRCVRPELAQALGQEWLSYDERRLETLMSRLRRKLAKTTGRNVPLRALRGQGYSFGEPLTVR